MSQLQANNLITQEGISFHRVRPWKPPSSASPWDHHSLLALWSNRWLLHISFCFKGWLHHVLTCDIVELDRKGDHQASSLKFSFSGPIDVPPWSQRTGRIMLTLFTHWVWWAFSNLISSCSQRWAADMTESLKTQFDFQSPVIQAQVSCWLTARQQGDMGIKMFFPFSVIRFPFVLLRLWTFDDANPVPSKQHNVACLLSYRISRRKIQFLCMAQLCIHIHTCLRCLTDWPNFHLKEDKHPPVQP